MKEQHSHESLIRNTKTVAQMKKRIRLLRQTTTDKMGIIRLNLAEAFLLPVMKEKEKNAQDKG